MEGSSKASLRPPSRTSLSGATRHTNAQPPKVKPASLDLKSGPTLHAARDGPPIKPSPPIYLFSRSPPQDGRLNLNPATLRQSHLSFPCPPDHSCPSPRTDLSPNLSFLLFSAHPRHRRRPNRLPLALTLLSLTLSPLQLNDPTVHLRLRGLHQGLWSVRRFPFPAPWSFGLSFHLFNHLFFPLILRSSPKRSPPPRENPHQREVSYVSQS